MNEIVQRLEEEAQQKRVVANYNLSRKSTGLVCLLSLVMPLIAYIYTGRWKALAFFLLFGAGLGFTFLQSAEPPLWLMVIGNMVALVDNVNAVRQAKQFIAIQP